MGSGGGGGGNPAALFMAANPMEGLPIAGKDDAVKNPFEYGQFQSFLPDAKAEGPNDMASGLRPDMFKYKSPTGVVAPSGDDSQIKDLRGELAKLKAATVTPTVNTTGREVADIISALQPHATS